jgi:hypothetical protein
MLYGKIAHNMIQVVFQLASEPATIQYDVPNDWSTEYFYNQMKNDLRRDFNISTGFCIVSLPQDYNGSLEDYPPMLVSLNETIEEYCKTYANNTFYICLHEN